MSIPFTRWPEEFARRYREKGYWQDLPLTDILTRHATSDSIAVIDGERQLSYRELNQAADNLACSLRRQGIKPGETALVQLGNVAELYITFFALLKLGVAPVLALFSHQRSELNAYASQIEPALLIADRQHALFSGDDFLNTFVTEHSSIRVVQLLNDSGEHNLQDAINHPAEDFTATPSPADEVAYFQLSGGQQQRVAIARSLIYRPALLLADEPTGNLDRKNGEEIIDLLKLSNRNLEQTILLITHDEKIALEADRVITIEDGKIVGDQKRR